VVRSLLFFWGKKIALLLVIIRASPAEAPLFLRLRLRCRARAPRTMPTQLTRSLTHMPCSSPRVWFGLVWFAWPFPVSTFIHACAHATGDGRRCCRGAAADFFPLPPARFPSNPPPHVPDFSRFRRPALPHGTARLSRLCSALTRTTTPLGSPTPHLPRRAVARRCRRRPPNPESFLGEARSGRAGTARDLIRTFSLRRLSCTRANQSSKRVRKSRHIRLVLARTYRLCRPRRALLVRARARGTGRGQLCLRGSVLPLTFQGDNRSSS
jgi:hypothetical protein